MTNHAARELVNLRWSKVPYDQRSAQVGHSGGRPKTYPPCSKKYHRFNKHNRCYYCGYERKMP